MTSKRQGIVFIFKIVFLHVLICSSWGFWDYPCFLNLRKDWLRYSRLKTKPKIRNDTITFLCNCITAVTWFPNILAGWAFFLQNFTIIFNINSQQKLAKTFLGMKCICFEKKILPFTIFGWVKLIPLTLKVWVLGQGVACNSSQNGPNDLIFCISYYMQGTFLG